MMSAVMNTSRRGWLTALTGFIALPVLPKTSASTTPESFAGQSIVDHFAALSYPSPANTRIGHAPEFWENTPRIPVTATDLRAREESVRDHLHFLRVRRAASWCTHPLESELQDIALARTILTLQPTGRPLTFRYSGGSSPQQSRTALTTLIFHTDDPSICRETSEADFHTARPLYLQAYCLERLAPRTFRLDRITNLTPLA